MPRRAVPGRSLPCSASRSAEAPQQPPARGFPRCCESQLPLPDPLRLHPSRRSHRADTRSRPAAGLGPRCSPLRSAALGVSHCGSAQAAVPGAHASRKFARGSRRRLNARGAEPQRVRGQRGSAAAAPLPPRGEQPRPPPRYASARSCSPWARTAPSSSRQPRVRRGAPRSRADSVRRSGRRCSRAPSAAACLPPARQGLQRVPQRRGRTRSPRGATPRRGTSSAFPPPRPASLRQPAARLGPSPGGGGRQRNPSLGLFFFYIFFFFHLWLFFIYGLVFRGGGCRGGINL